MKDNVTNDTQASKNRFERYGGWAAIAWLFLGLGGLAALIARESAGVSDPFDGAQMLQFTREYPLLYLIPPLSGSERPPGAGWAGSP